MKKQSDFYKIKEVFLHVFRYRVAKQIDPLLFQCARFDVHDFAKDCINRMCVELEAMFAGERFNKVTQIKAPANWKEAFKEHWFQEWRYPKWLRWLPRKLLKKYPIQYNVWTIDVELLYPKIKPSLDEPYKMRIIVPEKPKLSLH